MLLFVKRWENRRLPDPKQISPKRGPSHTGETKSRTLVLETPFTGIIPRLPSLQSLTFVHGGELQVESWPEDSEGECNVTGSVQCTDSSCCRLVPSSEMGVTLCDGSVYRFLSLPTQTTLAYTPTLVIGLNDTDYWYLRSFSWSVPWTGLTYELFVVHEGISYVRVLKETPRTYPH